MMATKKKATKKKVRPSVMECAAMAVLYSAGDHGGKVGQKELRLLRECMGGKKKFEGGDLSYLDSALARHVDEQEGD